ncbi:MAG: sugar phosphate isomerase/epimerase [Planctomycetota bacterium]|nr:sugar phosphate isomerase/epimerase [Planctomycetota bacterium]
MFALPLGVTAVMLPDLDFAEQLALCKKLRVSHYSIRPRIIPPDQKGKPWGNWGNHKFDLTPDRLLREAKEIRKQLDDAGIVPFGTVPGASIADSDDALKLHLEGSAAVGAGRVRVAPLPVPRESFDYAALVAKTVEQYRRVVELARPLKQKVVIETHCFSLAASPALALNICRHFKPEEIGTIFDLANFNIEGNYQPDLAVAVLGAYIDHVHIGGSRRISGQYDANGFRQVGTQMCPITEADLYMPGYIKALHAAGRRVPLMVENFTENVTGAARLTESATALARVLESLPA